MIKLTLKAASLLLMTLFSTTGWANSPFLSEEENAAAPTEPETVYEQSNDSPFATDEAPKPEPVQQQAESVETTLQQGDVLTIPQSSQAQPIATRFLDFPRRGMSTDKVQNELGRPGEIIPAIGQPPITRWVYDDRIVYFEYTSVIHVVAR